MAFTQRIVRPPLSNLIEQILDWEVPPQPLRYERILPMPRASLIMNLHEDETRGWHGDGFAVSKLQCVRLPGSVLVGPYTRSFVIDTAEQIRVMGVTFHAGGAAPFLRERLEPLRDRHVPLDDLFGNDSRRLRERLLEADCADARLTLLEHWLYCHAAAAQPEPHVSHALRQLHETPQLLRIDSIVRETGLSPRRFGALFTEQIGFGLKRYARLLRFHRVVNDVHRRHEVHWAAVAADGGFYDQSHLVREFRAFSGMTPGEYLQRRGVWVNHVPL
ncbi:MAG: AraC family transcriptional regulator [Rhodanobacteraceae bacterium]